MRRVVVYLGLLIVFYTHFSYAGGKNVGIGMPNPAASYCEAHGYQYEIVKTEKGEFGICKFPDGNRCSAWEFLIGKCGKEYTYCEKIGGKLVIVKDKRCWYNPECAVCKFPDGTEKEVLKLMKFKGGKTLKLNTNKIDKTDSLISSRQVALSLPRRFDWRDKDGKNWLTVVKDQGNCGSCWAFAAVGVIEAVYNIVGKNLFSYNLSEENLVSDCAKVGSCCGGWHGRAFRYLF